MSELRHQIAILDFCFQLAQGARRGAADDCSFAGEHGLVTGTGESVVTVVPLNDTAQMRAGAIEYGVGCAVVVAECIQCAFLVDHAPGVFGLEGIIHAMHSTRSELGHRSERDPTGGAGFERIPDDETRTDAEPTYRDNA